MMIHNHASGCRRIIGVMAVLGLCGPKLAIAGNDACLRHHLVPEAALLNVSQPIDRRRLETPSQALEPADWPCLKALMDAMRTAIIQHGGMGLAAVQIGVPVRVLLLRVRDEQHRMFESVLINPVIVGRSAGKVNSFEYCLSIPDGYRMTERTDEVTLSYVESSGRARVGVYRGDAAIVVQHEMDHLEGILIDRGLPKGALLSERRVQQLENTARRLKADYPGLTINGARELMWKEHLLALRRPVLSGYSEFKVVPPEGNRPVRSPRLMWPELCDSSGPCPVPD